jgi:hypothetical protein
VDCRNVVLKRLSITQDSELGFVDYATSNEISRVIPAVFYKDIATDMGVRAGIPKPESWTSKEEEKYLTQPLPLPRS